MSRTETTVMRQFLKGRRHEPENNGKNGPIVLENNGNNRTIHSPVGAGKT